MTIECWKIISRLISQSATIYGVEASRASDELLLLKFPSAFFAQRWDHLRPLVKPLSICYLVIFKGFVAHCGCHDWFKPNIKYEGQMVRLVFRERATNDEGYRALPSRTAKPHTQTPSSLLFPYFSNLNTSNTTDLISDKIKLLTLTHYCEVYCFKIYFRVKYRRWDIHESMKVWWYINGNSIGNKMNFFEGKSPLWCTASAHKMNRPVYMGPILWGPGGKLGSKLLIFLILRVFQILFRLFGVGSLIHKGNRPHRQISLCISDPWCWNILYRFHCLISDDCLETCVEQLKF